MIGDTAKIKLLSSYAHEAWSGWMRYMKEKEPKAWAEISDVNRLRWERQMTTPYWDLLEKERESDREEAYKILSIMGYVV